VQAGSFKKLKRRPDPLVDPSAPDQVLSDQRVGVQHGGAVDMTPEQRAAPMMDG
jgi:hypothetical protein